jgi:hypothetical protein
MALPPFLKKAADKKAGAKPGDKPAKGKAPPFAKKAAKAGKGSKC